MALNPIVELIKNGATVVDVRTEEEFEEEHYPNAICIPVNEIMRRAGELEPKDKPAVLYCASGARSAAGASSGCKSRGVGEIVNAGGLYDMPNF